MPVDNLLPFLFSIRSHRQFDKIVVVSSDRDLNLALIEQHFIRDALADLNVSIWQSQSEIRLAWQLVVLVKLFITCISRPVVFVDSHSWAKIRAFLKVVLRINKTLYHFGLIVITKFSPASWAVERFSEEALVEFYGRQRRIRSVPKCDVVLSSFPIEAYSKNEAKRFLDIGYCRGYQSWISRVKTRARVIQIENGYVFWPLSVLSRQEANATIDLSPVIFDTLRVFMSAEKTPYVVFRFHPTTDRNRFLEIVNSSGFKNYEISFEHPHILMQRCAFLFSNTGTSLYNDANFFDVPVVQYTPSNAAFCVQGKDGVPVASIYQPAVDKFLNSPDQLLEVLRDHPGRSSTSKLCHQRVTPRCLKSFSQEQRLLKNIIDNTDE